MSGGTCLRSSFTSVYCSFNEQINPGNQHQKVSQMQMGDETTASIQHSHQPQRQFLAYGIFHGIGQDV